MKIEYRRRSFVRGGRFFGVTFHLEPGEDRERIRSSLANVSGIKSVKIRTGNVHALFKKEVDEKEAREIMRNAGY